MDKDMVGKLNKIDHLADTDPLYQYMLTQCKAMEEKFDRIVGELSEESRGMVWDYVMLCEDMSQRKLQLACLLIPDELCEN